MKTLRLALAIIAITFSVIPGSALASQWMASKIPDCDQARSMIIARTGIYVGGISTDATAVLWRFDRGQWRKAIEVKGAATQYFVGLTEIPDGRIFVARMLNSTGAKWEIEGALYDPARNASVEVVWNKPAKSASINYYGAFTHGNKLLVTGADSTDQKNVYGFVSEFGASESLLDKIKYNRESFYIETAAFRAISVFPFLSRQIWPVYLAGKYPDESEQISKEKLGQPAIWEYDGVSFKGLSLPGDLREINDLSVTPAGTLFVGGNGDKGKDGRVWVLNGRTFEDTMIPALSVESLTIGADGAIVAAGLGKEFGGGVWAYKDRFLGRKAAQWIDLGLQQARSASKVTFKAGMLAVLGTDEFAQPTIWFRY